ncbi:MAG: ABC transporter ATP-binding protein [Actinobacteria bacterium]|nr:ABC transporter ATP-binding protein [Actinomycetota bacterium]
MHSWPRTSDHPMVVVEKLRVELLSGPAVVDDVSFRLEPGQILGLVGESGSGKTTTALALLGFARTGLAFAGGSVRIGGENILGRDERELRRLRGRLISYVPQDPTTALNPTDRVGVAVGEMLRAHAPERNTETAVVETLERVRLPSARDVRRRFPHQLSGGQQQRLAIAMALAAAPGVVVLDEPTTGLDVMTERHILREIERLRTETGVTMVYVTHDLSVVATIADRVAVMYAGRIIEEGPTEQILLVPKHPYTHGLVSAVPDIAVRRKLVGIPGVAVGPRDRPRGCAFAPRCPHRVERCIVEMPELEEIEEGRRVRCFEWRATPSLQPESVPETPSRLMADQPLLEVKSLRAVHVEQKHEVVAADDVTFAIARGGCVALVGESGSGKTTVARCVAGLHAPAGGQILLDGVPLAPLARRRSREACRRIQIVFQNPTDSLNPRHRVGDAIARPARILRALSRAEAASEVATLLERVRLPVELANRYPPELSGGERQRVAIARALAAHPDLVICDEVTSALDVSVQAAVLDVLAELRERFGLALLFISHDLGVVASIADEVLVLQQGTVREHRDTEGILEKPADEYTRALLEAAPRIVVGGISGMARCKASNLRPETPSRRPDR